MSLMSHVLARSGVQSGRSGFHRASPEALQRAMAAANRDRQQTASQATPAIAIVTPAPAKEVAQGTQGLLVCVPRGAKLAKRADKRPARV